MLSTTDGRGEYRVGHELIDEFLEFASGRARPNTVRAYAHDLSVFFAVIPKEPAEVTQRDVFALRGPPSCQPRKGAENVVRILRRRIGTLGLGPSSDASLRCRASMAIWSSAAMPASSPTRCRAGLPTPAQPAPR